MKKITPDRQASVLIVDDAGIINETCTRALTQAGFYVRSVSNPLDAFARLRAEPVHAVLLDLKMPQMTGLELMRVLRDMWPLTEVVVMTAYPESLMVEQCLELGAITIMTKPFPSLNLMVSNAGRAVIRSRLRQRMSIDGEALLRLILVDTGIIEQTAFEDACRRAEGREGGLRKQIVDSGAINDDEFEAALMDFLEIPRLKLKDHPPDLHLAGKVPFELIRRRQCLPLFEQEDEVCFITADPLNDQVRLEFESILGRKVKLVKGDRLEITASIDEIEARLIRMMVPLPELIERFNSDKTIARELLTCVLLQKSTSLHLQRMDLSDSESGKLTFSFRGSVTIDDQSAVKMEAPEKPRSVKTSPESIPVMDEKA